MLGFLPAEPPTPRPLSPLTSKEASEPIYFFQLHHHHHHQCVSCPHPSPAPNGLPVPTQKLSSGLRLPACSPALTPALLVDGIQASFKACRPTSSGTFPRSVSTPNHPPSCLPNKPASFPSTTPRPQAFAHALFAHSLCPECSSWLSLVIQVSSPMPLSQSSCLIISCPPGPPISFHPPAASSLSWDGFTSCQTGPPQPSRGTSHRTQMQD